MLSMQWKVIIDDTYEKKTTRMQYNMNISSHHWVNQFIILFFVIHLHANNQNIRYPIWNSTYVSICLRQILCNTTKQRESTAKRNKGQWKKKKTVKNEINCNMSKMKINRNFSLYLNGMISFKYCINVLIFSMISYMECVLPKEKS